ncbi:MAG: hypothetical protein ACI9GW_001343 [Halieaceae bacterium]|jgi:hypothetical protein
MTTGCKAGNEKIIRVVNMEKERRLYPRHLLEVPCDISWELSAEGRGAGIGHTVNVSFGSLQLRCLQKVADGIRDQTPFPPECKLSIKLPSSQRTLVVDARLVACRRLSQDSFQLGLEFIDFEEGVEEAFAELIAGLVAGN